MSGSTATSQFEARNAWVSYYAFEPYNGGDGVFLALGLSSVSAAIPGTNIVTPGPSVNAIAVSNLSSNSWAFVRLGDITVVATTASIPIPPNCQVTITLSNQGHATPQYIAGIAQVASGVSINAVAGWGN